MKKRIFMMLILNSDTPSSPSTEETPMHFTLDVHDAGSSQEGVL